MRSVGKSIEMGRYQVNYFIVIEANVTEMLTMGQALYQALFTKHIWFILKQF